jgi:hypothetical protein
VKGRREEHVGVGRRAARFVRVATRDAEILHVLVFILITVCSLAFFVRNCRNCISQREGLTDAVGRGCPAHCSSGGEVTKVWVHRVVAEGRASLRRECSVEG